MDGGEGYYPTRRLIYTRSPVIARGYPITILVQPVVPYLHQGDLIGDYPPATRGAEIPRHGSLRPCHQTARAREGACSDLIVAHSHPSVAGTAPPTPLWKQLVETITHTRSVGGSLSTGGGLGVSENWGGELGLEGTDTPNNLGGHSAQP